jgi:hypothetical protein
LLPNEKGTLVVDSEHVCYGYQLIAYNKYDRDEIQHIKAVKQTKNDYVISHLCGTRNCCNENHIILEPKEINDERTHCHFVMSHVAAHSGHGSIEKVRELGGCPHSPQCGSTCTAGSKNCLDQRTKIQ